MPSAPGTTPDGPARPGITVGTVPMPGGGGSIAAASGSFSTDESSGTATFTIPLAHSAGRDFEPAPTLAYSSTGGNGPFGLGFGLSLGSIVRSTLFGTPRYDGDDLFAFGGQLLVPTGSRTVAAEGIDYAVTSYAPRRQEDFALIERWSMAADGACFWRTLDAGNNVALYGRTAAARVADPADPARIAEWLIEAEYDDRGNAIGYIWLAEDEVGVGPAVWEADRGPPCQRYIGAIRYGVAQPFDRGTWGIAPCAAGPWHVEIVFDYGQYDVGVDNADPYTPVRGWTARPDPFSGYATGFEVRTHRLCRHVMLFHRFDALGTVPQLVHLTRLIYAEDPAMCRLVRVDSLGRAFDAAADPPYATAPLPPIELSYAPFDPLIGSFVPLATADGAPLPPFAASPAYAFADLQRIGAPGLLYADGTSTLFWPPSPTGGPATFGPPAPLGSFPIERRAQGGARLMDVEGSGALDLMIARGSDVGYYPSTGPGRWGGFVPFDRVPTALAEPDASFADLDGSGRADLVAPAALGLDAYRSLGAAGYAEAAEHVGPPDLPRRFGAWADQLVALADPFGTGGTHVVRVADGSFECWPGLGGGAFGTKVVLGGMPTFGATFDARFVILADLDGSGPADLLYLDGDGVVLCRNLAGNRFAEPVRLPLPTTVTNPAQVSVIDLGGTGTSHLLVTGAGLPVAAWSYAFNDAIKPWLLTGIDNNMGGTATIAYGSSTRHYLEDLRDGTPWATRLPFVVHVVDRVVQHDRISDSGSTVTYRYRHGRYDPAERQFLGFGEVQRRDAEMPDGDRPALSAASPRVAFAAAAMQAPPRLTRTWYALGMAGAAGAAVDAAIAAEWFSGDAAALTLPPCAYVWPSHAMPDAEDERQAHVAVHGTPIRVEIYGLDGDAAQAVPYQLQQYRYRVDELVPRGEGRFAVFMAHVCETVTADYDCDAADPATRHFLTLAIDPLDGETRLDCQIAYPRRGTASARWQEAQHAQTVTCNAFDYGHVVDDANHRLGVLTEWREHELTGLQPGADGYYTLEAIQAQVAQALAGTDGRAAARMQWERFLYWDEAGQTSLPLGSVGPRALLATTASADVAADAIEALFAGVLEPAALAATLSDALYDLDAASGWWWIPGDRQRFHDASGFYLPAGVTLPSGATIAYDYDPTWFALVRTTERASGVLDHVVLTDRFDYQSLQAERVIDANRNSQEVRFDPLGKVVLTSHYGRQLGQPAGFAPILGVAWTAPPSPAALLADPAGYLGGAANVLAYDLLAWCGRCLPADLAALPDGRAQAAWAALVAGGYLSPEGAILAAFRATDAEALVLPGVLVAYRAAIHAAVAACAQGGPACWAQVTAQAYPDAPAPPSTVEVQYNDGFGRIVQRKQQVPLALSEGGDAGPRWVTSGAARYDSRGRVFMRFDPFFTSDWRFTDDAALARQGVPSITFYDALDREVQVLTPTGFLRRAVFTAWSVTRWDENDSVLESPFWQAYPDGQGLDPLDWQALRKAALCADTPTVFHTDPLGRVIAIVAQTSRTVDTAAFEALGLGADQAATLFAALQAASYLDPLGALAIGFQDGVPLVLPAPFQPDADRIAAILAGLVGGGRPLVSVFGHDAAGEDVWNADPRLFALWPAQGQGPLSFSAVYSLTGRRLVTTSADGGTLHRIEDATGQDRFVQDGRGVRVETAFDALRRIQAVSVTDVASGGAPRIRNWYVYGDQSTGGVALVADPYGNGLIDEVWRQFDEAGLREIGGYSLGGAVLASRQTLRADPSEPIDWGTTEPALPSPLLAGDAYAFTWQVDALDRVVGVTDPSGAVTTTARNECGQVVAVTLALGGGRTVPVIVAAAYNANGQLETLVCGNGVTVAYRIDPVAFRLTGISATRVSDGALLQDMRFVYDPVGNLSHASDAAFATLWGDACGSDGSADYRYDALYRLTGATTPVRTGYVAALERQGGYDGLTLPMDGSHVAAGALETATWTNAFDDGGNAFWTGMVAASGGWQNEMVVDGTSNRSVSTTLFDGGPPAATPSAERVVPAAALAAFFDANGNQRVAETAGRLDWDHRNKLTAATCPGSTIAINVDAQGDLVRRVETLADRVVDTVRLGGYELVRTTPTSGAATQVVRVKAYCDALLAAEAISADGATAICHRMGDLALSVRMATDEAGRVLTAEGYTPFGATAFAVSLDPAAQDAIEERYDQIPRDRTTGFYGFPARWYAPWVRRWLSPDPSGQGDGMNRYAFVGGNPASHADPDGRVKITLADGSVVDLDHLGAIEALQQAVDTIRADVTANPLAPSGTARKMTEYTAKNQGDLLRLAFNPGLRGDFATATAASPYALKFGAMEFTEMRLGKERGVHGTVVIKGGGLVGYDQLVPTKNPKEEARRLSHLFRVSEVPGAADGNAGIVPVMAISESDRSEIGGLLGLVELQNIKYGKRTFDEAFVNGNDPYFIGAKSKGGAKALKNIDRKRRNTGITKSQVMTRKQTAKLKDSLETYVALLHVRPGKTSKFSGATSRGDVLAAISAHIRRKAGFGHLNVVSVKAKGKVALGAVVKKVKK